MILENCARTGCVIAIDPRKEMETNAWNGTAYHLILALIGALPTWPYSGGWGYYPSGGLGLLLVILIILVLMGRL